MSQMPFSDMHRQHTGNSSDKWTHYLGVYNRLLNEYRDQAINQFIGIWRVQWRVFGNLAQLFSASTTPRRL